MKLGLLLCAVLCAGGLFLVSCGNKTQGNAPPVTFDWDKGAIEADAKVAGYPKDMQDTYNNILKAKCTQCHPLSRALWAPYYDEQVWSKIITKMSNRPGTQVGADEV